LPAFSACDSKFQADVFDAQQVFAGVFQPRLGFTAAFAVFRYSGGLLQEAAQVLRLRLDDARNHALLDDRVAAPAQARAEENVGYIAPAHMHVVQEIRRLAVALEYALDRDLRVGRPGTGRLAQAVVEHQFDAGATGRLAVAGAVENDVLHVFAAQLLGGRFAEDPANGIDYVRFAATIGADDADQLARNRDVGRVDERLETSELDVCESHCRGFIKAYNFNGYS
jgi:hypothetical protein